MIHGNARIVRIAAAALTAALAVSICTAQEQPKRFKYNLPELALNMQSGRAIQADLNFHSTADLTSPVLHPRSFYEGYLIPGLEKQISRIGVLHTWVLDRPDLGRASSYDDLAAISERMFEKGAGRALRSYLSEITGMDTMVLNLAGRNGRLSDTGEASRFNLGIGISSAMPRVDIGYRIGTTGSIRLSLCADGNMDLNYGRFGRLSSTRFYTGFDMREGTADAGLRISF